METSMQTKRKTKQAIQTSKQNKENNVRHI